MGIWDYKCIRCGKIYDTQDDKSESSIKKTLLGKCEKHGGGKIADTTEYTHKRTLTRDFTKKTKITKRTSKNETKIGDKEQKLIEHLLSLQKDSKTP